MIDGYSRTQIEFLISEFILSSRNRDIMRSRFIDGLTYEKLSELYDLSVSQIKNIVYYGKEYLIEKGKSVYS